MKFTAVSEQIQRIHQRSVYINYTMNLVWCGLALEIKSVLTLMPKRINFIRAKYLAKHIFVEYKSELENGHRNDTH